MDRYCLLSRVFSREWRRNKVYTDAELRWLARRRGLVMDKENNLLILRQHKKEVVRFQKIEEPLAEALAERATLWVALKQ